jgi:hypothetical protein
MLYLITACSKPQVLATRYPRYVLRFSNRHEETYAAMMFFIERHYLKQWSMPGIMPLCFATNLADHDLCLNQVDPSPRTSMG